MTPCDKCGGTHFHRDIPVKGVWREFLRLNAAGELDIEESTTDNITYLKDPKTITCANCGKRIRVHLAPKSP